MVTSDNQRIIYMKRTLLLLLMGLTIMACNDLKNENFKLLAENDSLKIQIENDKLISQKLLSITNLIDEIEKSQMGLSINLESGIDPEDYEQKINNIQKSMVEASKKINSLSKVNSSYSALIKKYERDIAAKVNEIMKLNVLVAQISEENEGLITKVDLQNAEINEKNQQIETRQQELALIEAKVQELVNQAVLSQAEAFYAKGEAYYLAATRTKLAPRKKQVTLHEALSYYEQAEKLGVTEATNKISQIKSMVK